MVGTCAQHSCASTPPATWNRPSRTAAVHARTQRGKTPHHTCVLLCIQAVLLNRIGLLHRPNPRPPSSHLALSVRIRATRAICQRRPAPANCSAALLCARQCAVCTCYPILGPLPPVNHRPQAEMQRRHPDFPFDDRPCGVRDCPGAKAAQTSLR